MANTRQIKKISHSKPTIEGAGVHLKRAFGFYEVSQYDPFLLLDDFRATNPAHYLAGFPWHPHRGIETITYVLQGRVEHGDSMGNSGIIGPGDIQWMTAGSGIIHQEMPKGQPDGRMGGFQLWANLPAKHKMMPPRYRGLNSMEIPTVNLEPGVNAKIISGEINGTAGPVKDVVTDPIYLDVSVAANTSFLFPVKPDHTVLVYVIEGEGYFDEARDAYAYEVESTNYFDFKRSCLVGAESLLLFGAGDELAISTKAQPVRFLLFSGRPIGEPITWYGPIVMNTQEELKIAFDEYQNGTFIKHNR
jgi:quercetin 2,3-dioxygenase